MRHHPDCRADHPEQEHCRDEFDRTLSCVTPGCERPYRHPGGCRPE